jgi:hypothetical protein
MKGISQILTPLFPPDGFTLKEDWRHAIKRHGSPSAMAHAIASENRKPTTAKRRALTFRLAMMELRMVLAAFAWTFDAELAEDGQAEPFYKDAFIVDRGPCPVRISPRFKT